MKNGTEINMNDFTFKKYPVPTGLAAIGHQHGGEIKLKRRECGFYFRNAKNEFEVWFAVTDENEKCGWRNIRLHQRFLTEEKCREWIKKQSRLIQEKLNLHFYN